MRFSVSAPFSPFSVSGDDQNPDDHQDQHGHCDKRCHIHGFDLQGVRRHADVQLFLFAFDPALAYEERLARLRAGGVALWDVLAACRRRGSLDTAITAARPNDIAGLLRRCPKIAAIGCNGTAAFTLLRRFQPTLRERAGLTIVRLPSTSPAAAGIAYAAKRDAFRRFLESAGAGITPVSPPNPPDR